MWGGPGNDGVDGNLGADRLSGGPGDDEINGNSGVDFVTFIRASQSVTINFKTFEVTGEGVDKLVNIEGAFGSSHDDILIGGKSANFLKGRGGNDTFIGWGGPDSFNGGYGTDTVSYSSAGHAIHADLGDGTAIGQGEDVLIGIEVVKGSSYADVLRGNDSDNTLRGGEGNDLLVGLAGDDFLIGAGGGDLLSGKRGADALAGGPGLDTCRGGTGKNAYGSCER